MPPQVKWHGKAVADLIKKDVHHKLDAIGALLERDVKQKIGTPGPTKTNPAQPPSAPGEPPHKRTGALRRSIGHEVINDIVRVGTNKDYGYFLEVGTRKMTGPRPYLRPALDEASAKISTILGRPA